jgi:hypothetical protein
VVPLKISQQNKSNDTKKIINGVQNRSHESSKGVEAHLYLACTCGLI